MTPREKNMEAIGEIAYKYGYTAEDIVGEKSSQLLRHRAQRRYCKTRQNLDLNLGS
jgi:hypothetical protein